MTPTEAFKNIRDIPYRIPLALRDKDSCCNGKHKLLRNSLEKLGYEVRYRICTFLWSSMDLPAKLSAIPHNDNSTHVWLEILINNEWIIVDATWDCGIKKNFHINEWDGTTNTVPAVKPVEIFSPEKSAEIMTGQNDEEILKDLKINGEFYRAFNEWLEEKRNK